MMIFAKLMFVALALAVTAPAMAAGKVIKRPAKASGKNAGREKVFSREATLKGKDATKVDFEAADIGGQRKMPLGDTISQNKTDKNYDFVKIRLRWHPEMVQSASALDAGDSK